MFKYTKKLTKRKMFLSHLLVLYKLTYYVRMSFCSFLS